MLSAVQVGAGALGCEFLKNFALMGTSCGGWPYLLDAALPSAVLLLAGMLRSSHYSVLSLRLSGSWCAADLLSVRLEWPFLPADDEGRW